MRFKRAFTTRFDKQVEDRYAVLKNGYLLLAFTPEPIKHARTAYRVDFGPAVW